MNFSVSEFTNVLHTGGGAVGCSEKDVGTFVQQLAYGAFNGGVKMKHRYKDGEVFVNPVTCLEYLAIITDYINRNKHVHSES